MKTLISAAILAVSSLSLAGCAGGETAAGRGREIVQELTGPAATVTAAPGDTITLRITENRSTGYMWERGAPLPDGVVELSDTYVSDPQPEGEINTGYGGTHVFTYRCDRAASGTFAYKLTPPGDRDNPVEERRATLTCR